MCVVLEIETRLMSRPVKSETKILENSEEIYTQVSQSSVRIDTVVKSKRRLEEILRITRKPAAVLDYGCLR